MPGEHEVQRPGRLFCVSTSQGSAFTVNMKLGILTSPPPSCKPLGPLRCLPSGYPTLSCFSSLLTTPPHTGKVPNPRSQSFFYPTHVWCLDYSDGESLLDAGLSILDLLISNILSSTLVKLQDLSLPGTAPPLKSLIKNTHSPIKMYYHLSFFPWAPFFDLTKAPKQGFLHFFSILKLPM